MKKLAFLILAAQAHAAFADGDKAAAEALFQAGRKLMAAGKYADACPKFEASNQLDPGLGTMLNIADCYEKNGQLARSWGEWTDAADEAGKAGDAKRQAIARDRAKALEPKLPHLAVHLAGKAPDGLVVKRDGEVVVTAMLDTPVPVDPGPHAIEASAPGFQPWTTSVVAEIGAAKDVTVPALTPEAQLPPPPQPPPDHTNVVAPPPPPPVAEPHRGLSVQRKIAIGAAVVGVVGVGFGSAFGATASSDWSDVKSLCGSSLAGQGKCPSGSLAAANADEKSANDSAVRSDIAFGVGIAGVAAAAVLWFTDSPPKDKASARVIPTFGPQGGGVSVVGRF